MEAYWEQTGPRLGAVDWAFHLENSALEYHYLVNAANIIERTESVNL